MSKKAELKENISKLLAELEKVEKQEKRETFLKKKEKEKKEREEYISDFDSFYKKKDDLYILYVEIIEYGGIKHRFIIGYSMDKNEINNIKENITHKFMDRGNKKLKFYIEKYSQDINNVLDKLDTFRVIQKEQNEEYIPVDINDKCTICLDEFFINIGIDGENIPAKINEKEIIQTTCKHIFHRDCIDNYVKESNYTGRSVPLCPNCKREFRDYNNISITDYNIEFKK